MNITHITEAPNHMFGTISFAPNGGGFHFTVYQQQPNGEVLIWKATPFDTHQEAIDAWKEWGARHAWDTNTHVGMCKQTLDNQRA